MIVYTPDSIAARRDVATLHPKGQLSTVVHTAVLRTAVLDVAQYFVALANCSGLTSCCRLLKIIRRACRFSAITCAPGATSGSATSRAP